MEGKTDTASGVDGSDDSVYLVDLVGSMVDLVNDFVNELDLDKEIDDPSEEVDFMAAIILVDGVDAVLIEFSESTDETVTGS